MLKQQLQQKLVQKLSPQQIQLMKLLQLPTVVLEQRIKEELEANPALDEGNDEEGDNEVGYEEERTEDVVEEQEADEEFDLTDYMEDDVPDYRLHISNKGRDDEDWEMPVSVGTSFNELLESQLNLQSIPEEDAEIARYIIGNLDDAGYLRRDIESIVDDLAFSANITVSKEKLEDLLSYVQKLDPPGVGARSLQECLLLQLDRKPVSPAVEDAKNILESCFREFTRKHYNKIALKLELSEDAFRSALKEILKLNPKPGNSFGGGAGNVEQIVPDFILSVQDNELHLELNQRNAPELKISRRYNEMLESYINAPNKPGKAEKEAIMFVKQKIDAAKWFIDAIRQRQNTLLSTMEAIVEYQREYFLTGDETKLNPMILKDIAEKVELDISTISRVANSKYVQTPYGTFLLKYFFAESLATDSGEEASTREVKKILQDLIEAEDKRKPITDDKLTELLKEKGYKIARRTVAKYREQLNIPVARLRKEF
ncbi:MAG: RNA polymerase factor sigma-54 [Flavobacteriales bacterium]